MLLTTDESIIMAKKQLLVKVYQSLVMMAMKFTESPKLRVSLMEPGARSLLASLKVTESFQINKIF